MTSALKNVIPDNFSHQNIARNQFSIYFGSLSIDLYFHGFIASVFQNQRAVCF